jgi:guanosine-3',5'-bis(diphosphate) 3'-pyrophosphohydrolase
MIEDGSLDDTSPGVPARRPPTTAVDVCAVVKAMAFAARKHSDQRRKNREASPYINHPIDIANILVNEAGIFNTTVIVAAILHDTLEDTDATRAELTLEFGVEIAAIVDEVTDDKSLPKEERKRLQEEHAPSLSFCAQQVKLADKISNLRDMSRSPPVTWTLERKRDYFDWAKRVVAGLRGKHPRLEVLFDDAQRGRP